MLNFQIASFRKEAARVSSHRVIGPNDMTTQLRQFTALLILAASLGTAAWRAQVPGYVEISSPSQGQSLSGVVTIQGTAFHPAFQAYDVSFAYDPNPTDTWFAIGDEVTTPVSDSRLAVWDTSGLTPGTYQLRLIVNLEDGKTLESVVGGLLIGQKPAPAAASSTAPPTAAPTAAEVIPLPDSGNANPGAQPTPGSTLFQILKIGALSAMAALLLLAIYTTMRPRLRSYLGSVQNRRLDPRRRSRRQGKSS
jgi:hypothetical protein